MNERIKQLAEQADEYANSLYSIHGESMKGHYQDVAIQKFAELIVQECANIVEDAVDHREPASAYVSKIKQHFGVE